jgi:hypothetical protein
MTRKLSIYEHEIEDTLALRCAQAGHLCLKFVSPGFPGVPDRVVLTKDGRVAFVEVKAPGQLPRRTQPQVLSLLRQMGHRVELLDTHAQIEPLMQSLNT